MIKDSGQRREFETGAVRDMASKGRCDLLPWSIIPSDESELKIFYENMDQALHSYNAQQLSKSISKCLDVFVSMAFSSSLESALLEVSYLFEDGCKKYGERNWEKGIPINSYLDSAGRHFLKWCRGDVDERHDRAVIWNLICALWTIKHKPEAIL